MTRPGATSICAAPERTIALSHFWAGRIEDCRSNFVITADEGLRGGRKVPLKANTDKAIANIDHVEHVIVVKRTGGAVDMKEGRDVWYDEICAAASPDCPPVRR